MPETSIVIKAEDRYSYSIKSMTQYTKSFSKEVDSLEDELYMLSKNKAEIQVDVDKAKKALKEAQKQYEATKNAQTEMNKAPHPKLQSDAAPAVHGKKRCFIPV